MESIILFGSAVAGDFHPGLSNLNLFCVLRDSSFAALQALAPAAKWWDRQKQPPPLCMTRHELERSTDVFTIELLDMQQHHRVVFGEDVLQGLQIPTAPAPRAGGVRTARKAVAASPASASRLGRRFARMWDLLIRSVPSFATLFRHALIVLGAITRPWASARPCRR